MTDAPETLTVKDVARILRVGEETVYQLVHSRRLRSSKPGNAFRIPREALDDYLRRGLSA